MATQASSETSHRPGPIPILWGAAAALAAVAAVMLIAAGWITLIGQYPDHAQQLAIPLTEFNTAAGKVEQIEGGARLIPDEGGVAIVLFDTAPRFPAFQFSQITVELDDGTSLRGAEVLWATLQIPDKTRSLPLNRDGDTLTVTIADSPEWTERINGIGLALMTQSPVEVQSVNLHPPDPTLGYVMTRMWREWTYHEGYQGYTINGLRGAGRATLYPIGLAGGLALFIAVAALLITTTKPGSRGLRNPSLLAATTTLWMFLVFPWVQEVWVEAIWSAETYAGKTDAERRLVEPDGYLYDIAQRVKKILPPPPQKLFVVNSHETQSGSTNYERTKIHYYLAPHNVLSRFRSLPAPRHNSLLPGDYVLVLDSEHPSYNSKEGHIHPGYRSRLVLEHRTARLYRVLRDE